MAPISCSILLIFLLSLVVPINSTLPISPIWDLKDPKVIFLAKFAVTEHNKEANATTLRFVSVFNADYSVYTAIKHTDSYRVYDLDISANDDKTPYLKHYSASVLYRSQNKNSLELQYFDIYKGNIRDGLWPIEYLKDPKVVSVAKFAVEEYNKKANTTLQFVTIIQGKKQMVAGDIYHLLISAKDNSSAHPKKYEIKVSDKPREIKGGFKLESFKKLSKLIW